MYDPGGIYRLGRWLVEATGPIKVERLVPGLVAISVFAGLRYVQPDVGPGSTFTIAFCIGNLGHVALNCRPMILKYKTQPFQTALQGAATVSILLGPLLYFQSVIACQIFTTLMYLFWVIAFTSTFISGSDDFALHLLPGPAWDRYRRQMLVARACQKLTLAASVAWLAAMLTPEGWLATWAILPVVESYVATAFAGAAMVYRDRLDE
jgi:hypothetical protein